MPVTPAQPQVQQHTNHTNPVLRTNPAIRANMFLCPQIQRTRFVDEHQCNEDPDDNEDCNQAYDSEYTHYYNDR